MHTKAARRCRLGPAMTAVAVGLSAWQPAVAEELKVPSESVPAEWLTPCEQADFLKTPRYEETVAFCRRLDAASDWITMSSFGVSPLGRELPVLVVSDAGAFDPAAARAAGKLVVLVQNCIHAGECDGKDASLMLLRDIAITKTQAELLKHVVLVVIPIFNVDGHERYSAYSRINQNGPEEMGWRVTSRNLNLNRDYVKADAVEMRAWLALWNRWQPDFLFDNHTTDGGDWQYDVTYALETHAAAPQPIAQWMAEGLERPLVDALTAVGHKPFRYFDFVDGKDPTKGIRSGGFGPRYSTGYAAVRNRPSILVETHMLKPHRTRVIATYNLMRHALEIMNEEPEALRAANAAADREAAALGAAYDPQREFVLSMAGTEDATKIPFLGVAYRHELSEVSGAVRIIYDATQPVTFEVSWFNGLKVAKVTAPPVAYAIPPQWTEVIELARLHGLACERLLEPVDVQAEAYQLSEPAYARGPFEGRVMVTCKAEKRPGRRTLPTGMVIVPLDQPGATTALHLFEPEAPDSLVAWGFFHAVFEEKEYAEDYVLEKLAREMLAADSRLREEFLLKVRTDAKFASDAGARLKFFYERSPYWDTQVGAYPVLRLIEPVKAATEAVR